MNGEEKERRVAVLIDAENIAPKYLPIVLSEANNLGSVNIKRIYGDWTMPQMAQCDSRQLNSAHTAVLQCIR